MQHWWDHPETTQRIRAHLTTSLQEQKLSKKQGGALFSALLEALTAATGEEPVFTNNCLWVWDSQFGVWARVTHPHYRHLHYPTYGDLWAYFEGLKVWVPGKKGGFAELRVDQAFEVWMDKQPGRSTMAAAHRFFDNATPGVICPTLMPDDTTEMRLWYPNGSGGLSHEAPSPNHRKRSYYYKRSEPLGAQRVPHSAGQLPPDAPEWIGYLRTIWGVDPCCEGKIKALEEHIGASMLGVATKYQRLLIWEGEGGAGKSLLIEAITKTCFEEELVSSTAPSEWAGFAAPSLDGPLLNVVTEMPEGKTFRSDRFKSVISGDRVTVARKNQNEYSMRPVAGHIIAANKLPPMSDPAVIRRLFVMRFNRTFMNSANRKTEAVVLAELREVSPQIRIRCLFAAGDLMRRGDYELTDEHVYSTGELVQRSSPTKDFIDSALQLPPESEESDWVIEQAALYKAFRLFCGHSGVTYIPTARNFYKDMEVFGLRRENPTGSKAKRRFLRVHLKPEEDWGFDLSEEIEERREWRH